MPYQPSFEAIVAQEMKKLKKLRKMDDELVNFILNSEIYNAMFAPEEVRQMTRHAILQRVEGEFDREIAGHQQMVNNSPVMDFLLERQLEQNVPLINEWGMNAGGTGWKHPFRRGARGDTSIAISMVADLLRFLHGEMEDKYCPLWRIYEALRPKWRGEYGSECSYRAAVRDRLQDRGYVNAINHRGWGNTLTPQNSKRYQNPNYRNYGKLVVFYTSMNQGEKGWRYIHQEELARIQTASYDAFPHLSEKTNCGYEIKSRVLRR